MEQEDYSCHLQTIGSSSLVCAAAAETQFNSENYTGKTIKEKCINCKAGKIFREVGCDQIRPELRMIRSTDSMGDFSYFLQLDKLFCRKRREDTTLEQCLECNLVNAETTRETTQIAKGIFQANGFETALNDFTEALKAHHAQEYKEALGLSLICLESTMKIILDREGIEHPKRMNVNKLWERIKDILQLSEFDGANLIIAMLDAVTKMVQKAGAVRNALGRVHGEGEKVSVIAEETSEMGISTAGALATFIVRRYSSLKNSNWTSNKKTF